MNFLEKQEANLAEAKGLIIAEEAKQTEIKNYFDKLKEELQKTSDAHQQSVARMNAYAQSAGTLELVISEYKASLEVPTVTPEPSSEEPDASGASGALGTSDVPDVTPEATTEVPAEATKTRK